MLKKNKILALNFNEDHKTALHIACSKHSETNVE